MLEADGIAAFTARRIAERAETSLPAVYELFGDKAGLVRAIFFEGFRLLRSRFDALAQPADALAGLVALLDAFRTFARAHPVLSDVMFSRPFADFDPGPEERKAGSAVRERLVGQVRACVRDGSLVGDPIDLAHVLLALAQGLTTQEKAGWLGSSKASIERRWRLAVQAALAGFSSPHGTG